MVFFSGSVSQPQRMALIEKAVEVGCRISSIRTANRVDGVNKPIAVGEMEDALSRQHTVARISSKFALVTTSKPNLAFSVISMNRLAKGVVVIKGQFFYGSGRVFVAMSDIQDIILTDEGGLTNVFLDVSQSDKESLYGVFGL